MAREGYRGVTLKQEWIDAIDDLREQFRYPPSRTELIYEALAILLLRKGIDPAEYLDEEDLEKFFPPPSD